MSVACDHCGARYEVSREDGDAEAGIFDSPPACRECGFDARWVKAAAAEAVSDQPASEEVVRANGSSTRLLAAPDLGVIAEAVSESRRSAALADAQARQHGEIALGEPPLDEIIGGPESLEPITQPAPAVQSPRVIASTRATMRGLSAPRVPDLTDSDDPSLDEEATRVMPVPPDSVIPLSSRDFVGESGGRARRRVPHPPHPHRHAEPTTNSLDDAPVSLGSPSLATLIERNRVSEPHADPDRPDRAAGDILGQSPLDTGRDSRISGLPGFRAVSEAPVATTTRPTAPAKPSRNFLPAALALLALGGAFYAGASLQRASRPEPPPEASKVEPVAKPAEAPVAAAMPIPEAPAPAAEVAPAAPEPEKVAPVPEKPVQAAALAKPRDNVLASTQRANTNTERANERVSSTQAAEPAEPKPAPEPAAEFDSNAASVALDGAAQRAGSCRKDGDPSGVAVVLMTFSPSGRVTSANVAGPPFAGTATGGCIASTMRSVKVPPYAGDFITVKKTLTIQ